MKEFNPSYVNVRHELLKFVTGDELTVLDVGCATGANSGQLRRSKKASFVVGIEHDCEMAEIAKNNVDKLIVSDLNSFDCKLISSYAFDYIIFGDILEHLLDPWRVLANIVRFLKDGGRVIISVPNIQHIETFIQLYYHSRWPYNDRGLFDYTHIKFFTLKNLVQLVDSAGLTICELERVFRFRDDGRDFPRFMGAPIKRIFPNLFTFQYIVSCRKKE